MPYFPQLSTGAIAQYPLRKKGLLRSIVSRLADRRAVKLAEPQAALVEWDLPLRGLNLTEAASVESLFLASEGRLSSFVFLDPAGNLLQWSEDLTNTVWVADPLLQLTAGIADPFGGTSATRLTNTAQTTQSIGQAIDGPGAFHYCCSVYARAAVPTTLHLRRASGSASGTEQFQVTTNWRRVASNGNLETISNGVTFAIDAPAGGVVEVFGLQAEAQIDPSPYRRTTDQSGVFAESRFGEDELVMICEGPDHFATRVRILSRTQG